MSVAMSIVFTGLCALVTDADRAPAQMLLVDARSVGEVDGVPLPEHAPTLVVSLGALANAATSSPTRIVTAWPDPALIAVKAPIALSVGHATAGQIGLWDLSGSEVRIRVQGREGAGLELYRPSPGASSWPEPPGNPDDPESWRDPRFLASMKALTGDGRIDPALIAVDGAAPAALPRGVAARFYLDAGRLEAGVPSQETQRSDVFEFGGAGLASSQRQALTDTIRWSLESESSTVVIEITPAAGGPTRRLVFAPSASEHGIFVSNLPADDTAHADQSRHEQHVSMPHFAAYYELLMNEPTEKPLPRLWLPPVAGKGTAGGRPVFCGPAVFSRR
jgi:hypothetical protein